MPGIYLTTRTVHLPEHSIAEAIRISKLPFWVEAYAARWPDYVDDFDMYDDMKAQQHGFDRLIELSNGIRRAIEEKYRRKVYNYGNDTAFELQSNIELGTPGWFVKDSLVDYLTYAILPLQRLSIINDQQLKEAATKGEWVEKAFEAHDIYKQTRRYEEVDGISVRISSNRGDYGEYNSLVMIVPRSMVLATVEDIFEYAWARPTWEEIHRHLEITPRRG